MSEDSLISLSNSRFSLNHSSSNKKDLSDRFVNDELHKEGICKRLNFNNQDIESELKKGKFGGK